MRGEESVAKILEFAKSGKGGAKKIDHDNAFKLAKSEKMKTRRKPIKPKNVSFISPFECLHNIVKKYDTYETENIHYMCISFILKNVNESVIMGHSCADVDTNHIFTHVKKKRRQVKNDNSEKEKDQLKIHDLENQLSYHLQCEEYLPLYGLVLDPRQCQLRDVIDKQFSVKIFNFNSEQITLPPNTNICKIFIYAMKV